MRKMKSEAGSITMVVFATLTFILIILSTIFTTMVYKSKSQTVELKEMINAYDGDMAEIYNAKNKSGYFDLKVGNTELKDVTDITDYYGETTNFESVEGIDWQLFYSDADYYFVIASDYVPVHVLQQQGITELFAEGESTELNPKYKACFAKDENWQLKGPIIETGEWSKGNASNTLSNNPLTSKYLKWVSTYTSSTNYSARALAYMMDMDKWKNFAGDVNGAIAIGGPTMELLVNSFNAVHSGENEKLGTYENIIDGTNATQYGYKVKKGTGEWREMGPSPEFGAESNMWCIQSTEKADAMWLASPSTTNNSDYNMADVDASNYRGYYNIQYFHCGFRPLVAIPRENKVAKSKLTELAIEGTNVEIPNTAEGLVNYYGMKVTSFSSVPNVEWQLYYDDEDYYYLIATDYVPYSTLPKELTRSTNTTNQYSSYCAYFNNPIIEMYPYSLGAKADSILRNPLTDKYLRWIKSYPNSTNGNIKATAFMMDTEKWANFAGNQYSNVQAIGGPTIELFTASYNTKHSKKMHDYSNGFDSNNSNSYGYSVKWADDENAGAAYLYGLDNAANTMWLKNSNDRAVGMWLASPSSGGPNHLRYADKNSYMNNNTIYTDSKGFRPIVFIKKTT